MAGVTRINTGKRSWFRTFDTAARPVFYRWIYSFQPSLSLLYSSSALPSIRSAPNLKFVCLPFYFPGCGSSSGFCTYLFFTFSVRCAMDILFQYTLEEVNIRWRITVTVRRNPNITIEGVFIGVKAPCRRQIEKGGESRAEGQVDIGYCAVLLL